VAEQRPNIVLVVADDHAAHAVGCYGSRINDTPSIDRIAAEGMRFDACFCTNSLCAPSRATILTGTYNHVNGVLTLSTEFDARQPTFVSQLHEAGYQTAIVGKWHLGHGGVHDPRGFDHWEVLPDQGDYFDPELITPAGRHRRSGYATDVITDLALEWLSGRDPGRPFCLLVHHKAPHRSWEYDDAHAHMFTEEDVPVPATYDDDYSHRSTAAAQARMRVRRDLTPEDLKEPVPEGLGEDEEAAWKYQRYIKDYLRCVAALDDNVGRLLDALDEQGLAEDTAVVYTSDQGFFLGDHGWYDKRFMYEESLRMPLLVRYPREVPAGTRSDALVLNVDFAQTFLDLAGVPAPPRMQGRSLRPLLHGEQPADWRRSVYYRYWEHDDGCHHVWAHYGVRTRTHKLVRYYADGLGVPGTSDRVMPPEWELFDLERDPQELHSVHDDPDYAGVRAELEAELARLQAELGDVPHHHDSEPESRPAEAVGPIPTDARRPQ
jgi:arylsulfatase A-like enzyme